MLGTIVVTTMEAVLAAVQVSRLEALRLRAGLETGYAIQANIDLFFSEMLAVRHRTNDSRHDRLKSIIRNNSHL
jgi:hypothetical protein